MTLPNISTGKISLFISNNRQLISRLAATFILCKDKIKWYDLCQYV